MRALDQIPATLALLLCAIVGTLLAVTVVQIAGLALALTAAGLCLLFGLAHHERHVRRSTLAGACTFALLLLLFISEVLDLQAAPWQKIVAVLLMATSARCFAACLRRTRAVGSVRDLGGLISVDPHLLAAAGLRLAQSDAVPGASLGEDPIGRPIVQVENRQEPVRLFPAGIDEPGVGRIYKRCFDLVFGLLIATIVAPVILIAILLTCLRMGWPPIYTQVRLTRDQRPFVIHKIRTMIRDAEPDGTPVWPVEDDPRITPLGHWLRRLWIDELVQLWDVLRGHMSLVGPRPERPEFASSFTREMPMYQLRCYVQAGLTGLAQARGFFGDTSIERRLDLDLEYIRSWTPLADLQILAATIGRVLARLLRR